MHAVLHFSCEHNCDCYTCSDCCDLRATSATRSASTTATSSGSTRAKTARRKGKHTVTSPVAINKNWELQNPATAVKSRMHRDCEHHSRKEEVNHAKAG